MLEQAGITVDKFGGEAFRDAVTEGNTKLARLLLEKGADITYHKPDMVFPYASTPVTEAARSNNFPMVRWLMEQGADITIADKYGDRPYTVAVQNKWCAGSWSKEPTSPLLTNTATGLIPWRCRTRIRSWPTT